MVFEELLDILRDIPHSALSRIGDAVVEDNRDPRKKQLNFHSARFGRLFRSGKAIGLVDEKMAYASVAKCRITKQRERLALQVGSGDPVIQENAFELLESFSLHLVDIAEIGIERDAEFCGLGDRPFQLIANPEFLPRAAAAQIRQSSARAARWHGWFPLVLRL
jgi:hypothetical protein